MGHRGVSARKTVVVTCGSCDMKIPEADACGHITAAQRGRELVDIAPITTEIRDVVEGLHGRPKNKRGVQVVLAQVIARDGEPHWIAKVKFGGMIVAKTTYAYPEPRDAIAALLIATTDALRVLS